MAARHYIPALMIALTTLCGCQDDTLREQAGQDREISFRATGTKNQTQPAEARAGETTANNISSFNVSAHWRGAGTPDAFSANFMYNVDVQRSGGVFGYSPKKYIPSTGYIDFYAFSPSRSLSATIFAAGASSPAVSYVVPAAANLQEDFLIAYTPSTEDGSGVWSNPWDATGKVEFEFSHALSQVVFEARCVKSRVTFFIKEISFTNLTPRGDIDLETQLWSNLSGTPVNYPADIPDPVVILPPEDEPDYTAITSVADGTAMMVLPQTVVPGTATTTSQNGMSHIMLTFAAINWNGFPLYGKFVVDSDNIPILDGDGLPQPKDYAVAYIPLQIGTPNEFEQGTRYTFRLDLGNSIYPVEIGDVTLKAWPAAATPIPL